MKVVIYANPKNVGDQVKKIEFDIPPIGVAGNYTIFSGTADYVDQFVPYPVAQAMVGDVWSASQFFHMNLKFPPGLR
jgi:hypothetical protein